MSSRGHVSDFMQGHLADLSPDDLQALLDAINMQSRLRGLRANLTTTSASLGAVNNKVTKKSKSASKTSIATGQIAKAKRPLNSWMAFRSYYSPIFVAHQQKKISGLVKQLWEKDPFHNKWAILAKAYSIIRDQVGKDAAPLDRFLQIAIPCIDLIIPEYYLTCFGLVVQADGDECKLEQICSPELGGIETDTTLSAEDIVSYCFSQGFGPGAYSFAPATTSNSIAMACRPQVAAASDDNLQPAALLIPSNNMSSQDFSGLEELDFDDAEGDQTLADSLSNALSCHLVNEKEGTTELYTTQSYPGFQTPGPPEMPRSIGMIIAHHEQILNEEDVYIADSDQWNPNLATESALILDPFASDNFVPVDINEHITAQEMEELSEENPYLQTTRPEGDWWMSILGPPEDG